MKNEIVVRAPRSFIIFLFQFFAIVPFGTAFGLILLPFLSKSSNNLLDILILSSVIILLFAIGFSMLYFPQKNISTVIYDKENRVLKKIKKGEAILSCDLNSAEAFILKNIKEISVINFDHQDVMRHPLVTKIVEAYQKNTNDKG